MAIRIYLEILDVGVSDGIVTWTTSAKYCDTSTDRTNQVSVSVIDDGTKSTADLKLDINTAIVAAVNNDNTDGATQATLTDIL